MIPLFARELLETSAHVAVVVLIALAVERIAARALTPGLRVGLWLLVALRLTLPSLPSVPEPLAPNQVRLDAAWSPLRPAPTEQPRATERAQRAAAAWQPGVAAQAPRERPAHEARGTPLPARASAPPSKAPLAFDAVEVASAALLLIWLAGASWTALGFVRSERALRRALSAAQPAGAHIDGLLRDAAERTSTLRRATVWITTAVSSPAVHGWRRPRVLLPPDVATADDATLTCVLAHECCHVRRGDLALAPWITLLRALWWFHPCARIALSRLVEVIDTARDAEAIAALSARPSGLDLPPQLLYARTLVRLATARVQSDALPPGALTMAAGSSGLVRRVQMIVTPLQPSYALRALGAVAVVGAAWLGLASAMPQSTRPAALAERPLRTEERTEEPQPSIAVEVAAAPPAWLAPLQQRLRTPLPKLEFVETPLPAALSELARQAGVDIELGEAVRDNSAEYWVTLSVEDVTAEELLPVLTAYAGDWGHAFVGRGARGVVRVDSLDALPVELELRLYHTAPLMEALASSGVDAGDLEEQLSEAVRSFATGDPTVWERDGASVSFWEGLLCVRHTAEVHAEVHGFLERLVERRREPPVERRPWQEALRKRLGTLVDVECDGNGTSDVLVALCATAGISIIDPTLDLCDYDSGAPYHVSLQRVPFAEALSACLSNTGLHWRPHAGGIEVQANPWVEVHLHPVGALMDGLDSARRAERFAGIEDFLYQVDPDRWEFDDRLGFSLLGDVLIVRQSPENQRRIKELLDQLERALRR